MVELYLAEVTKPCYIQKALAWSSIYPQILAFNRTRGHQLLIMCLVFAQSIPVSEKGHYARGQSPSVGTKDFGLVGSCAVARMTVRLTRGFECSAVKVERRMSAFLLPAYQVAAACAIFKRPWAASRSRGPSERLFPVQGFLLFL